MTPQATHAAVRERSALPCHGSYRWVSRNLKKYMLNIFKKKTELDILRKKFKFLESDFGYDLLKQETKDFYRGKNLIIYRSDPARKQIEICGNNDFFRCIIRKIENQQLTPYSNGINNIGIEDLAMVDNPGYDSSDYHSYGEKSLIKAANRTSQLFKRQNEFLKTEKWIDIEKVESLKNGKLSHRFRPVKNNKPDFFISKVNKVVKSEFPEFELIFSNEHQPSYHKESLLEKLIYQLESKTITIKQKDWRDYREIYSVFMDDTIVDEIDTSRFENQDDAIEEIKKACNKVYSA